MFTIKVFNRNSVKDAGCQILSTLTALGSLLHAFLAEYTRINLITLQFKNAKKRTEKNGEIVIQSLNASANAIPVLYSSGEL